MNPYHDIELKARQADPSDRQSIHDLAKAIVIQQHLYSIPESIASVLEDRLTDAEIRFRNKTGQGASEQQLVDLLNWMGQKLKLPSYATTTLTQVRVLRMHLSVSAPILMGNALSGNELKRGDHVRTELSPLQAMHLFYVMADQKILNEDYQDPTLDIVSAERDRAKKAGNAAVYLRASTNPKEQEMRNVLSSSISSMSFQDAFDILDHALKTTSI
jgi:hypothetical protein